MKKFTLLLLFSVCSVDLSGTSFLAGLIGVDGMVSDQPKSIIARVVDALPNEDVVCCTEMLKDALYKTVPFFPVGIACWLIIDFVNSSSPVNQ